MERISANSKRCRFKERLARRIVSGEFPFGSRFPGLYELCDEYGISYVTVCKAVKMLADEGYLRCHPGVGYFVCFDKSGMEPRKEVNLISTPGYYGEDHRADFDYAQKLFGEHGWKINLLLGNDLYDFTEQLSSPRSYSIITAFNVNWERFSATFGHMVSRTLVLGRLSGNPEITSIVCDEYETIRQCMDYFAARGKKKIALASALPQSELESLRIAAWRTRILASGLSLEWSRRHLISLDLENQTNDPKRISGIYRDWLRSGLRDAEGIILPNNPACFLAVCRERNVKIPGELEVVSIGSEVGMENGIPFLDNNFKGHFQYALKILEERYESGGSAPGSWYFCSPLGVRSSFRKNNNSLGKEKAL